MPFILPNWPAPSQVKSLFTTRVGGVSQGRFASLNVGDHVGDDSEHVKHNRDQLCQQISKTPESVHWLNQVHGTDLLEVRGNRISHAKLDYDGSVTCEPSQVLVVMTADCLPLLICDQSGAQVAAVHVGWRGLCAGIIETAVRRFADSSKIMVWMGPAISQVAFEVGQEVFDAFCIDDIANVPCFKAVDGQKGKWLADLYALARVRLKRVGVSAGAIFGGEYCTYSMPEQFYSYRRDGQTGRMASLIWLSN
jgi:YfiH family protein